MQNYLKPFGVWGIALRDRLRNDLFFRTTCIIVSLQVAFTVVMLGLFWWALHYTQGRIINAVAQYIVDIVTRYPQRPPDDFATVASNIRLEIIVYVFIAMTGLSILLGFLLAHITLGPARKSLQYQKRFIGNIAHELRTPLSIIKTSTEVTLLDAALPLPIRRTLDDTIIELDRISEIINNLLSFNTFIRPERMQFENVALGAVIDTVLSSYASLAHRRGVEIVVHRRGGVRVWGNQTALEQMAANLVKNAIHYTLPHQGGIVTVTVGQNEMGDALLRVSDTGIGIPEEELFHIFEPFYRGDTSRARGIGGESGLGLAIVNEVVRVHQGKISLQSAVSKGTTVTIELPQQNPASAVRRSHEKDTAPARAVFEKSDDESFNEIAHDFSTDIAKSRK